MPPSLQRCKWTLRQRELGLYTDAPHPCKGVSELKAGAFQQARLVTVALQQAGMSRHARRLGRQDASPVDVPPFIVAQLQAHDLHAGTRPVTTATEAGVTLAPPRAVRQTLPQTPAWNISRRPNSLRPFSATAPPTSLTLPSCASCMHMIVPLSWYLPVRTVQATVCCMAVLGRDRELFGYRLSNLDPDNHSCSIRSGLMTPHWCRESARASYAADHHQDGGDHHQDGGGLATPCKL